MSKLAGIILFLFITISLSSFPPFAAAAGICPKESSGARFNALCSLSFTDNTLGSIVTVIFVFAILLALAYLIWGGVKWVLSGGDKAKVDAARQAILASIIGLVVVFLSYFVINVVVPIFVPGFSLQNLSLPRITSGSGASQADIANCEAVGGHWDTGTDTCQQ